MTEVERARDKLLRKIGGMLAALGFDKGWRTQSEDVRNAVDDLEMASAKQHDLDRNGIRRAMKLEDCTEPDETKDDLPIPEEDCQACAGTGMRGPDRTCGACEGSGIASSD